MDTFIRKSRMRISVTFTATDESGAAPTGATCHVAYKRKDGKAWTESFPLTQIDTGAWVGEWDSSNAAAGEVDWLAECDGPLVGAVQGTFLLDANRANK